MVESNEIHRCATPRRARVEEANESTPLLPHNQIDREQSMKKLQALFPPVCRSQLRRKSSPTELDFAAGAEEKTGSGSTTLFPTTKSSTPSRWRSSSRGSLRYLVASGDGEDLKRELRERSSASRARGERKGNGTSTEFERSVAFVRKRTRTHESLPTARSRSDDARGGARCKREMVRGLEIDFAQGEKEI